MKHAILDELSKVRSTHKFNLIGRQGTTGPLDWRYGRTLTLDERLLAVQAFNDLVEATLIRPTLTDLTAPEDRVEITEAGRRALERRALDPLDEALLLISPSLLDSREGAWSARSSGQPDSLRQLAHSARELIDQVLKEGAPDEDVRALPGFQPDRSSRTGITRRHRLRFLMRKFKGQESETDLKVAESTLDAVIAIDDKLQALSHGRSSPEASDVDDALHLMELLLKRLLV
jgi:hypothetical protein